MVTIRHAFWNLNMPRIKLTIIIAKTHRQYKVLWPRPQANQS